MSTTFRFILDQRRKNAASEKYLLKLRVTHKRVLKEFATKMSVTESEFARLFPPPNSGTSRVTNELQVIRENIKAITRSVDEAIDQIAPFSFVQFKMVVITGNQLFQQRGGKEVYQPELEVTTFDFTPFHKRFPIFTEIHTNRLSISVHFLKYIKQLLQEDRIGSALSYQNTYTSLKTFCGNVMLNDITPGFLFQYEKWMLSKNRRVGTVGVNLRPLRAIFNEAIADGVIRKELCYPFGKRKYVIPKSRNVKKALTIDAIGKLFFHKTEDVNERRAIDYWFFCYFGNGMNPKDAAHLKFRNIDGDYIRFIRSKTAKSTRDDPRTISVFICPEIKDIMERRANKDSDPDNYIFPILEKGMTTLEQHYMIRSFIRFINDRMKRIGAHYEISTPITTIVSRHSFSTQLKRSGASTEFIQESLGHTDKSTTENYLDSFDNDVKKQYASALSAFRNINSE